MTILNMSDRPGPMKPMKMRWYGPVDWLTGPGIPPPFKVERRRIGGCSPECWTDESCGVTLSREANPDGFVPGTVVLLAPKDGNGVPIALQRGFEYRITLAVDPATGKRVLRCALPHLALVDAPEVVDFSATPYVFQVCDSAADGDANDDGFVNFADITTVLANFQSVFCLTFGDADRNGTVNFADVTNVLTLMTVQPPSAYCITSGQSVGGHADGFAAMALDRADQPTTAAAAAVFILDALNQMGYASIDAFGDAIAQMDEATRNAEIRRLGQLLEGAE
jgi:hypothetical protein